MRYTEHQLYNMTSRQYVNAIRGYEKDRDSLVNEMYNSMRIGTAWIVMASGNIKKGRRIKPSDIVRLRGEDNPDADKLARLKYVVEHSRFPDKLPGYGQ